MTCCAPGAEASAEGLVAPEHDEETLFAASRDLGNGLRQLDFNVPDIHCAACIATVEGALAKAPGVSSARVNLSTKRARVIFKPGTQRLGDITSAIENAGYRTFLPDPTGEQDDGTMKRLTRALAVAGFAFGNIMLFSVSVWSGTDPVTRDLFHWISALIAVPAVAYAGQPFYQSAWRALRKGGLNMDVPISLAVLLALCLSLFETLNHGDHAYFDAATSLLFFLLVGRTLDHLMREKARGTVRNLARLAPREVMLLTEAGREKIALSAIRPGMRLELAPGERVPVDARIISGRSDIDMSAVTGESVPEVRIEGELLLAGATSLSGRLEIEAMRPAAESYLARMIGLMEAAEGSRAGYRRIADRAAAIYAPAVHLLALATFVGWMVLTGDWYSATTNAIAVLIVTCPCALALAVPIVHVVASGRLFDAGMLMKDGAALERLAGITEVAFDKTGTLTEGRPHLVGQTLGGTREFAIAAGLAQASRHPLAAAIAAAAPVARALDGTIREVPGAGIELDAGEIRWRLGNARFCNASETGDENYSTVWLAEDGSPVAAFALTDQARTGARAMLAELEQMHLGITLLSGDRQGAVTALADELGINRAEAGLTPDKKLARIAEIGRRGDVLMVGDGINDAPALRAATVSIAPSSASDVGRNAADFVFTRPDLSIIPFAIRLARRASAKVRQNFGLAIAYNLAAVPLAVSGQITPLIAALAMSSSSILVTLNALTLRLGGKGKTLPDAAPSPATHLAAAE